MNYEFSTENISQHIVKYGVDIRPALARWWLTQPPDLTNDTMEELAWMPTTCGRHWPPLGTASY